MLGFATFTSLAIAIAAFWIFSDKKISLLIFVASILFGLIGNRLNILALPSIAALGITVFLFYKKSPSPILKILLFIAIFVITTLMFLHKIPGFNNWQIYDEIKLSKNSAPFDFWLNFDKPLIALFLLLFAFEPVRNIEQYKEIFKRIFPYFLGLLAILSVVGIGLNYIVFDPKLPGAGFTALWVMKLLFFTAIVEELFFRFFIQNNLISLFSKFKYGQIIGLTSSALSFALFHFGGDISFVLLAFISGMIYGWIYIKTKYLESAILLHFLINLTHFIFFSYPYFLQT